MIMKKLMVMVLIVLLIVSVFSIAQVNEDELVEAVEETSEDCNLGCKVWQFLFGNAENRAGKGWFDRTDALVGQAPGGYSSCSSVKTNDYCWHDGYFYKYVGKTGALNDYTWKAARLNSETGKPEAFGEEWVTAVALPDLKIGAANPQTVSDFNKAKNSYNQKYGSTPAKEQEKFDQAPTGKFAEIPGGLSGWKYQKIGGVLYAIDENNGLQIYKDGQWKNPTPAEQATLQKESKAYAVAHPEGPPEQKVVDVTGLPEDYEAGEKTTGTWKCDGDLCICDSNTCTNLQGTKANRGDSWNRFMIASKKEPVAGETKTLPGDVPTTMEDAIAQGWKCDNQGNCESPDGEYGEIYAPTASTSTDSNYLSSADLVNDGEKVIIKIGDEYYVATSKEGKFYIPGRSEPVTIEESGNGEKILEYNEGTVETYGAKDGWGGTETFDPLGTTYSSIHEVPSLDRDLSYTCIDGVCTSTDGTVSFPSTAQGSFPNVDAIPIEEPAAQADDTSSSSSSSSSSGGGSKQQHSPADKAAATATGVDLNSKSSITKFQQEWIAENCKKGCTADNCIGKMSGSDCVPDGIAGTKTKIAIKQKAQKDKKDKSPGTAADGAKDPAAPKVSTTQIDGKPISTTAEKNLQLAAQIISPQFVEKHKSEIDWDKVTVDKNGVVLPLDGGSSITATIKDKNQMQEIKFNIATPGKTTPDPEKSKSMIYVNNQPVAEQSISQSQAGVVSFVGMGPKGMELQTVNLADPGAWQKLKNGEEVDYLSTSTTTEGTGDETKIVTKATTEKIGTLQLVDGVATNTNYLEERQLKVNLVTGATEDNDGDYDKDTKKFTPTSGFYSGAGKNYIVEHDTNDDGIKTSSTLLDSSTGFVTGKVRYDDEGNMQWQLVNNNDGTVTITSPSGAVSQKIPEDNTAAMAAFLKGDKTYKQVKAKAGSAPSGQAQADKPAGTPLTLHDPNGQTGTFIPQADGSYVGKASSVVVNSPQYTGKADLTTKVEMVNGEPQVTEIRATAKEGFAKFAGEQVVCNTAASCQDKIKEMGKESEFGQFKEQFKQKHNEAQPKAGTADPVVDSASVPATVPPTPSEPEQTTESQMIAAKDSTVEQIDIAIRTAQGIKLVDGDGKPSEDYGQPPYLKDSVFAHKGKAVKCEGTKCSYTDSGKDLTLEEMGGLEVNPEKIHEANKFKKGLTKATPLELHMPPKISAGDKEYEVHISLGMNDAAGSAGYYKDGETRIYFDGTGNPIKYSTDGGKTVSDYGDELGPEAKAISDAMEGKLPAPKAATTGTPGGKPSVPSIDWNKATSDDKKDYVTQLGQDYDQFARDNGVSFDDGKYIVDSEGRVHTVDAEGNWKSITGPQQSAENVGEERLKDETGNVIMTKEQYEKAKEEAKKKTTEALKKLKEEAEGEEGEEGDEEEGESETDATESELAEAAEDSKISTFSTVMASIYVVADSMKNYPALSNLLYGDQDWYQDWKGWADRTFAPMMGSNWFTSAICDNTQDRRDMVPEGKAVIKTVSGTYQAVASIQMERSDRKAPILCYLNEDPEAEEQFICDKKQVCVESLCYKDDDRDGEPDEDDALEGYFYKITWGVSAPRDESLTPYVDENGISVSFNIWIDGDANDKVDPGAKYMYYETGNVEGPIELKNSAMDTDVIVKYSDQLYKEACIKWDKAPQTTQGQFSGIAGLNSIGNVCFEAQEIQAGNVDYTTDSSSSSSSGTTSSETTKNQNW